MNYTTKFLTVICFLFLITSCVINKPKPEDCIIKTVKITKVTEGSSHDIVFHDGTNFFYINRGLERGLNFDSVKAQVLNRTVTLHLAKVLGGIVSEHISQLAIDDEIIFTEFN